MIYNNRVVAPIQVKLPWRIWVISAGTWPQQYISKGYDERVHPCRKMNNVYHCFLTKSLELSKKKNNAMDVHLIDNNNINDTATWK